MGRFAAQEKKLQELASEINDIEISLKDPKLQEQQRRKLNDKKDQKNVLIAKLTNQLNEAKFQLAESRIKDNAQLVIMNELKRANAEKDSKIKMYEKNSKENNDAEIIQQLKEATKDVSEEKIEGLKRKYNNYIEEWLAECNISREKKTNYKK